MSCTLEAIDQAVVIIRRRIQASDPKPTFLALKDRLVSEAAKRHRRWLQREPGSAEAILCTSDWCTIFIKLLDHPDLQAQSLEALANAVDALERGYNLTVMEVFKTL